MRGPRDGTPGAALHTFRDATRPAFPFEHMEALVQAAEAPLRAAAQPWIDGDAGAGVAAAACEIAANGSLAALPRLRTSLEWAGCNDPTILDACTPDADPVRTAWIVETLLHEPRCLIGRGMKRARRRASKP